MASVKGIMAPSRLVSTRPCLYEDGKKRALRNVVDFERDQQNSVQNVTSSIGQCLTNVQIIGSGFDIQKCFFLPCVCECEVIMR